MGDPAPMLASRSLPQSPPARESLLSLGVMAVAAALAAVLAPRVVAGAAGAGEAGTLARALPGAVGAVVTRLSGAPALVGLLASVVPLSAWGVASLAARFVRSEPRSVHRGL